MSKFVILCAVLGLAVGLPEKPGPYPPKDWKPQGPRLDLPRQYGSSGVQRSAPDEIEFTTVVNDYLPPTTVDPRVENDESDVLRVQELPAAESESQFRNFQRKTVANVRVQPQAARIQFAPAPAFAGQPLLLSSVFAPQFAPVSGQLQEQRFGQQVQSLENPENDVQQVPTQTYGQPPQAFNPPPQTYNPPPQSYNPPPQSYNPPPQSYNPPPQSYNPPPQNFNPNPQAFNPRPQTFNPPPQANVPEEPDFVHSQEPESPKDDENEDEDDSDERVIAVSNVVSNGDAALDARQGRVGQYYILLPDKSLQKVRFATKQTEEDRQINGFSAQLRYSPVEAIRDPVFGYDEQGKLVRLYK